MYVITWPNSVILIKEWRRQSLANMPRSDSTSTHLFSRMSFLLLHQQVSNIPHNMGLIEHFSWLCRTPAKTAYFWRTLKHKLKLLLFYTNFVWCYPLIYYLERIFVCCLLFCCHLSYLYCRGNCFAQVKETKLLQNFQTRLSMTPFTVVGLSTNAFARTIWNLYIFFSLYLICSLLLVSQRAPVFCIIHSTPSDFRDRSFAKTERSKPLRRKKPLLNHLDRKKHSPKRCQLREVGNRFMLVLKTK